MRYELNHPVTEESAREFVDNTSPSDITDAEREQRTRTLLEGAAANHAWRNSRDIDERVELQSVPFAVHDTEDETPAEDGEAPATEDPATEGASDNAGA